MKKLTLLLGIGALTLASCSNDDLVNDTSVNETANPAIGFAVSTGNMTRAEGDPTELYKEHWDFGVWGYKGTETPTSAVMADYMVGYWNGTTGYNPTASQQLTGTNFPADKGYYWYYETLGKLQQITGWTDREGLTGNKGFDFIAGDSGKSASTSEVDYQYLKYWDKAAGMKTWFYAYAPYSLNGDTEKVTIVDGTDGAKVLTFPKISSVTDNGKSAMYAGKLVTNPNENTNSYVDLEFKRLLAQVRMAFYEVVEGYKVELIDYSSKVSIPDSDPWKGFGHSAMYAVPAVKNDDDSYSAGSYVTAAIPVVTFDKEMTATVSYNANAVDVTNKNINIPLWFFDKDGNQTNVLTTNRDDAIMNQVKEVIPAGSTYCGFTINLSLKFTALDTDEEIIVRDVKVHIPKADCQWLANHRYTYYFKVTKTVPGSPTEPQNPTIDPGDKPYLLPIVFDRVTVQAIEDVEHDYNVNKVD